MKTSIYEELSTLGALKRGYSTGTHFLFMDSKRAKIGGIDYLREASHMHIKSALKIKHLRRVKFKILNFSSRNVEKFYDVVTCFAVTKHFKFLKLVLKNPLLVIGITAISVPSSTILLHRLRFAKYFDKWILHSRGVSVKNLIGRTKADGLEVISTKKIEDIIRKFLPLNLGIQNLIRHFKFFDRRCSHCVYQVR